MRPWNRDGIGVMSELREYESDLRSQGFRLVAGATLSDGGHGGASGAGSILLAWTRGETTCTLLP